MTELRHKSYPGWQPESSTPPSEGRPTKFLPHFPSHALSLSAKAAPIHAPIATQAAGEMFYKLLKAASWPTKPRFGCHQLHFSWVSGCVVQLVTADAPIREKPIHVFPEAITVMALD
jgi:hypothetical protein